MKDIGYGSPVGKDALNIASEFKLEQIAIERSAN